jgi:hypothetical protein
MLITLIHSGFVLAPIKFQPRFCFQSVSMFFSRVLARRRAIAVNHRSARLIDTTQPYAER